MCYKKSGKNEKIKTFHLNVFISESYYNDDGSQILWIF